MSQNNISYRKLVFDLLKTLGVSFLAFFLTNNLIRAFLEGEERGLVISLVFTVAFYCFYAFSFYVMHAHKSAVDYSLGMKDEVYSFRDDIKNIIGGEGKALMMLYGIFAAISAVCKILPAGVGALPSTILLPMFPIGFVMGIPFLSEALGWVLVSVISVLTLAYSHRRIHVLRKKGKL